MVSNIKKVSALRKTLSASRMTNYDAAAGTQEIAIELYAWNAEVSSAFLFPLHVCEVVVRNAVAECFEIKYGSNWPWVTSFERSLNNRLKEDLSRAKDSVGNTKKTGKVIAELNFFFWQSIFTKSHDFRIWNQYLLTAFPNLDNKNPIPPQREGIYQVLDELRHLRNRIAHHEPIFKRDLLEDYEKIKNLIALRCEITANWLDEKQNVKTIIEKKPNILQKENNS